MELLLLAIILALVLGVCASLVDKEGLEEWEIDENDSQGGRKTT